MALMQANTGSSSPFSCRLCGTQFHSSRLYAEHFDDHFLPGKCGNCDQQVLLINGEYYYLQIHITTKCFAENQQILRDDDDGLGKNSSTSIEVDIKEEKFDKPFPYEDQRSTYDQPQSNDVSEGDFTYDYVVGDNKADIPIAYESENDEFQKREPEFIEVHGGEFTIVKLEDTSHIEISDLETSKPHILKSNSDIETPQTKLFGKNVRKADAGTTAPVQHRKFQCSLCKTSHTNRRSLKAHVNTHGATLPCDICSKQFCSIKSLNQHKQRVHGLPNFQCKICKKYYRETALKEHMIRMHSTGRNQFDSNGDRIPQLQCDICKMLFFTKSNVIRHMVTMHHSEPPKKDHICTICGKGYASVAGFTNHLASHNNPNPYKMVCNFCGEKFQHKSKFHDHLNVKHLGVRPFKCTHCDKSFLQMRYLRNHIRIHTGVKPYICSEDGCDRAFTYSVDLKRHLWGQHKFYAKK